MEIQVISFFNGAKDMIMEVNITYDNKTYLV